MESQNLWGRESISPKTLLMFLKNFLDLQSDTIKKQVFMKLSSNVGKSYEPVVFSDFEVSFLWEGMDDALNPFLYCVLFE